MFNQYNYGEKITDFIKDECVFQIFESTADMYPDNIAISFKGVNYSYQEIEAESNKLAHYLRSKSIKKGDCIGIVLDKSPESYISMLGVLKSGSAYVPIDTSHPEDRIKFIIEDCNLKQIITTEEIAKKLNLENNLTFIENGSKDKNLINTFPETRLTRVETGVTKEDLCYIIFTSGSTGRPKGVQLEHQNVCNLVRASQYIYKVVPEDRVYQGFTTAFDASVEEIWMAFANGATLVPATLEMQRAGAFLGKFLNEEKITVLSSVPTLLSIISDDIPSLRLLIFGGEVCSQNLLEKWSKNGIRLINTYGPTEATVIATYSELKLGEKVTIGKPVPNYSVFIRSEDGQFLENGQAGELLIGGVSLARGYLGREDLTNEKFIYSEETQCRLYRTGDLALINEQGNIDFLGRIDDQVKIRGYRVELSEIENVINMVEGIKASIVNVYYPSPNIQTLVAYLVPEKTIEDVDIDYMYEYIKEKLPAYMIPQHMEFIDKIPTLTSGKADRKKLPIPTNNIHTQKEIKEPTSDLEIKIAEVWKTVFNMDEISIDSHFFNDLGGHSLLVSIVISNLRRDPRLSDLKFSDIYECPTIELLADKIDKDQGNIIHEDIEERKKRFLSVSSLKYFLCGAGQAVVIYLLYLLLAIPILSAFYTFYSESLEVDAFIFFGIVVLYFPYVLLTAIIVKWLVIGKFKAGKYPLWGSYYFRWWVARLFQSIVPVFLLNGTPLMSLYLRAMGAKIAKNTFIGTNLIQTFDLVNIGSNSSIGLDSQLLGYTVEDGYLILGNINIGKDCYVGTHSIISNNTKMEDGSMVLEQSMIPNNTTIPEKECWFGSPAKKAEKVDDDLKEIMALPHEINTKKRFLFGLAHLASLYIFQLIPAIASIPVSYIMYIFYLDFNFTSLLFAPVGGFLFVLIMCLEIVLIKKITLGKVHPAIYDIHSNFYLRKWIVDQLMYMSLSVLHTLYATLYTPIFLRFMGAKIAKNVEVSTVTHISPDLLTIDEGSFSADASMIGTPKIYMGKTKIAEVKIGKRTFIGNSALLPINKTIKDNCLIGVLSIPPLQEVVENGTSWLGSPSIYLHKRDINTNFPEKETYAPTKDLYIKRGLIEFFRVILPPTITIALILSMFFILGHMDEYLYVDETIALFPLAMISSEIVALLVIVLIKKLLIGAYVPKIKPLWSTFIWKTELVTGIYESAIVPFFMSILRGTPFISMALRLLGCKIGKKVFMDSTFISEFDLVHIDDEVAINFNATMQTHLFEDRVMKMSHLRIKKQCSVGSGSVVLYDTLMEEGSKLGNLSLLMKGEVLPKWTSWEGNPASPNHKS